MAERPLGWVQNPSSFDSLKRTVQIFCPNTENYNYLCNAIPRLVDDESTQQALLTALSNSKAISYRDLVGTGTSKRSEAPCDALVQASIHSQKESKPYIDNWSSDGFVRWAECLGFIAYNQDNDTFSVTFTGERFARCSSDVETKNILIERMFTYPPAVRVLQLLYDADQEFIHQYNIDPKNHNDIFCHSALSKYQIGSQLGFNGENGFTSYSTFYINRLMVDLPQGLTHSKIRSDIEGSSDKYARMISTWLKNLGLVQQVKLGVKADRLNEHYMRSPNSMSASYSPKRDEAEYDWYVNHSYQITSQGAHDYRQRILQTGKRGKSPLHVTWNMLATKASPASLLRTRRGMILKFLERKSDFVSPEKITEYLVNEGLEINTATVKNDLKGFEGIGISFDYSDPLSNESESGIKLVSILEGLDESSFTAITESQEDALLEKRKQVLRDELFNIDAKHIELVELAYDYRQNRLFESKILEVINDAQSAFSGKWLGGSRRPDGILWNDFYFVDGGCLGVILDAKAYSKGYTLDIKQADQMYRYIEECLQRDKTQNPNEWWRSFPFYSTPTNTKIKSMEFAFLFVTSEVAGNGFKNAETLAKRSGINGRIVDAETLLRALSHINRYEQSLSYDVGQIQKVFPFSALEITNNIARKLVA